MEGFKRIFGPDGLMQFAKTLLKLIAVGVICWMVLKPHAREFENMAAMSPADHPAAGPRPDDRPDDARPWSSSASPPGPTSSGRRCRFAKRMRMTKEEVKEDYKNSPRATRTSRPS